jgi:hypothetical protein
MNHLQKENIFLIKYSIKIVEKIKLYTNHHEQITFRNTSVARRSTN